MCYDYDFDDDFCFGGHYSRKYDELVELMMSSDSLYTDELGEFNLERFYRDTHYEQFQSLKVSDYESAFFECYGYNYGMMGRLYNKISNKK